MALASGEYTVHKYPTLYGSHESVSIYRSGNDIVVSARVQMHKPAGSSSNPSKFGYRYAVDIRWNGERTGIWKYLKSDTQSYSGQNKTWTDTISGTLSGYTGSGTVTICFVCCGSSTGIGYDGQHYTYGCGCDVSSSYSFVLNGVTYRGPFIAIPVISQWIDSAYTPSSIWLNPNDYTKIGKVGSTSYGVHYSYNAGSNSNVPISLAFHEYGATSWGVKWEPVLRYVNGSSDGVWDYYTLNSSFANGSRYRITLVSKGRRSIIPKFLEPTRWFSNIHLSKTKFK